MPGRRLTVLITLVWILAGFGLWWLTRPAPPPPGPELAFEYIQPRLLPEWELGRQGEAVPALKQNCERFAKWPDDKAIGPGGIAGEAGEWRHACKLIDGLDPTDHRAVRQFLETEFRTFRITWDGTDEGLFTGYYEPLLQGSRQRSDTFATPLLRRPDDLLIVNLDTFDPKLKGKRIRGRIEKQRLVPYPDRAAIENSTPEPDGVIAWVDDPIDAFFLHIQGSGRVRLEDGTMLRVGYAEQNGRKYVAIGRELIRNGEVARRDMSMQAIRAWLKANPDKAQALMNTNPSYIFFHELKGPGPLGSLGVPLTPGRSLAIDRRLLPLGVPFWLDTKAPSADPDGPDTILRRLMVAEDTGGAIRGGLRGDVFWGHGRDAAEIAGRMKHQGRLTVFLPKDVSPP